jgi:hypothetical protein
MRPFGLLRVWELRDLRLRVQQNLDVVHTLLAQRLLDVFAIDRLPLEEPRYDCLERATA